VPSLESFLAQPNRPPGTLQYQELQGFLFAVASAPALVRPSEWLPLVFGDQEPEFSSQDEAQRFLGELMLLYNSINEAITKGQLTLPSCREEILTSFDVDAPVSQWSRGFMRGHQWLEDEWKLVPKDLEQDFVEWLITLTLFSSKELATAYLQELGRVDLEPLAIEISRALPDAATEYARLGRAIHKVLLDTGADAEAPKRPKVGRNELCPCGSGRKYKKCCGSGAAS
jgi:uncharacterized protein